MPSLRRTLACLNRRDALQSEISPTTLGRTLTKLVANTFKNVRFEWTCRIFSMFWTNICGKSLLPRMRRKERIYFPKCLESSPSNCGDIDVSLTQSVHVDSYGDRYEL